MADPKDKVPPGQGGGGRRPPRRMPSMPPLPKMPQGNSFWLNLATSVVLLLLLAGAYTYFSGVTQEPQQVAISQLAADISAAKFRPWS